MVAEELEELELMNAMRGRRTLRVLASDRVSGK
jgi:hypothetical protein